MHFMFKVINVFNVILHAKNVLKEVQKSVLNVSKITILVVISNVNFALILSILNKMITAFNAMIPAEPVWGNYQLNV